jgi:hypothetical protein
MLKNIVLLISILVILSNCSSTDESNVIDERKAKLDAVEDECSYAYFDNEFFLGQDTLICYKDGSAIKSSSKNNDEDNSKEEELTNE